MENTKKIGRPALSPAKRRSVVLHVKLTPAQHAALQDAAFWEDMPVAALVRQTLGKAGLLGKRA